jgi:hypothetical protein
MAYFSASYLQSALPVRLPYIVAYSPQGVCWRALASLAFGQFVDQGQAQGQEGQTHA